MSRLRVVDAEPGDDQERLIIRQEDGTLSVDQGSLGYDAARAMIATAFIALCAPPDVEDDR